MIYLYVLGLLGSLVLAWMCHSEGDRRATITHLIVAGFFAALTISQIPLG